MSEERIEMDQEERDRLQWLKQAKRRQIRQREAAERMGVTERWVRKLLWRMRREGDRVVVHGLRGRPSNRQLTAAVREKAVRILSQEVYRGFGPTLASEYLLRQHHIRIGRECLRQVMLAAGLWRRRRQKIEAVHLWRPRRSSRGELVQWDTSQHDWLEGRGEKLYLIHMIDDATSELTARFVGQDSTAENMRLLWRYLERHGRPAAFYTDKASMFQTAPKTRRDGAGERDPSPLPPTQIGRALRELGIEWIAAHSPQAKGRIERSFRTAQDRLIKGLRVAAVRTLQQANHYLEEEFLPWWNQHLQVQPAQATDAHRPLSREHDLGAILSEVHSRQVGNDYTFRFQGQLYQIARGDIRPGLRGSVVRIEARLEGSIAVRCRQRYLTVSPSQPRPKTAPARQPAPPAPRASGSRGGWHAQRLDLSKSLPVWMAANLPGPPPRSGPE
jgi:DNA-binding Lrp family transcriptional regulator